MKLLKRWVRWKTYNSIDIQVYTIVQSHTFEYNFAIIYTLLYITLSRYTNRTLPVHYHWCAISKEIRGSLNSPDMDWQKTMRSKYGSVGSLSAMAKTFPRWQVFFFLTKNTIWKYSTLLDKKFRQDSYAAIEALSSAMCWYILFIT